MKRIFLYAILLIFISISCNKANKPGLITTEGHDSILSVFKTKKKEYHIWTKNQIQTQKEALDIREKMNLYSDYTMYFYNDSTLDEEHYYASYLNILNKNDHVSAVVNEEEYNDKAMGYMTSELNRGMYIESIENVVSFLGKIDKAKKLINESSNGDLKKELSLALSSFQTKYYQKARIAYYKNAKDKLWEKNIKASMSGKNITFVGYMFIDNKVKKDTYLEIKEELTKLRFKTVGFKAYDGDDKTYWELDSKEDNQI